MISAVIQARMGSTRLPGKALLPLMGRPMLAVQIERVKQARLIDRLVIATSGDPSDLPIMQFAQENGIACIRGAVDDVLDRYYQAAKRTQAEHIVRLTADCPLIDARLIDEVIRAHMKARNDYTSNVHPPTYPDGMDVEAMTFAALDEAWSFADKPSEREHVTSYFRRDLPHIKRGNVASVEDNSHLRLTVDEAQDLETVKRVLEGVLPLGMDFSLGDILTFLKDNPDIAQSNTDIERNAGYAESLKKDAIADPRQTKGAA